MLVASAAQVAPAQAGQLALPLFDSAGTSSRIFLLDLDAGRVRSLEPRRGGESLRVALLAQNVFGSIGRPADQAAIPGEFLLEGVRDRGGRTRAYLLVETSTGYAAYLLKPGQGDQLGEVRTIAGRPLQALVGLDGQYLALPRQDSARRSDQIYVVHTSTGDCVLLDGVEKPEQEPQTQPCDTLPSFRLASNAVTLRTSSGTTTGYLVVDAADSSVLLIGYGADGLSRLVMSRSDLRLAEVFPATEGQLSGRRFSLAPVADGDGATGAVLVLDRLTGRLAMVRNLAAGSRLAATLVGPELTGWLTARSDLLTLDALAREGQGRTTGVWLLGERARRVLWVSDLDRAGGPTITTAELRN